MLLRKIGDLEERIKDLREPDGELENELLRAQLEQHTNFFAGFLDQMSAHQPHEDSYMGEVSRSEG